MGNTGKILWLDISHHQEDSAPNRIDVDLSAVKRGGIGRIGLKATQGTTMVDPWFERWYRLAHQLGMATVPYHYAVDSDDPAADFAHFQSVVNHAGGLRPGIAPDGWPWDFPCLDNEDNPNIGRAEAFTRGWGRAAVAAGWTDGCLYTGRWFGEPAHLSADDLPPGWRWLWLSDYRAGTPDAQILLPTGWDRGRVFSRQYTDNERIVGINGPVDASHLGDAIFQGQGEQDVTAEDVWGAVIKFPANVNDVSHLKPAYTAEEWLTGISVQVARLLQREAKQDTQIAGLQASVTALATLVAKGANDLTAEQVTAIVSKAVEDGMAKVVHVDVSVTGPPSQAPAPSEQGGA